MEFPVPHGMATVLVAPFVGSFLGVVASRHGEGRSVVRGRSACDSCGQVLTARDLVPLLSWAVLRGRCRHCRARIDPMLPLIEAGAIAIAAVAVLALPGALVWIGALLGWWLIVIAAIDWRHLEIPDSLSLPLVPAGLVVSAAGGPDRALDAVIGAAVGFAAFAAIAWAYRRLRGHAGLGDGDARLMAAAGAWVGWQGLAAVILYGAGTGLAWALAVAYRSGRLDREMPMAFGPFLGFGLWLTWMLGPLFAAPPWMAP